ncbi:hypothetical protein ACC675_38270, partial [Rhizobium ruizarguesonis]
SMLKQQLQDAAAAEGESGKAHDMLSALEAGTLTITDPSSASLLSNQALSVLLDTLSAQSDTSDETDTTGDVGAVTR